MCRISNRPSVGRGPTAKIQSMPKDAGNEMVCCGSNPRLTTWSKSSRSFGRD
jgi:hypothetical protein